MLIIVGDKSARGAAPAATGADSDGSGDEDSIPSTHASTSASVGTSTSTSTSTGAGLRVADTVTQLVEVIPKGCKGAFRTKRLVSLLEEIFESAAEEVEEELAKMTATGVFSDATVANFLSLKASQLKDFIHSRKFDGKTFKQAALTGLDGKLNKRLSG